MTSLSGIVDWIRGHGCERLVTYVGNEIEISGLSLGAGTLKADVGKLSNKIKELERANELAKALDDCQYLLCTSLSKMELSDELRDNTNRFRIMTIMSITQLRTLLAALDQQDEMVLKRELGEWIQYTNALFRQATAALFLVNRAIIGAHATPVVRGEKHTVKKRETTAKKRAKKRAKVPVGTVETPRRYEPVLYEAPVELKPTIDEILMYQGIDRRDLGMAATLLR